MSKSEPRNIRYVSGVSVYAVNTSDDIINVDTSLSGVTIVLPNIPDSGLILFPKVFYINDCSGNANNNNIGIIAAGSVVNSGLPVAITIANGSAQAYIADINEYNVAVDSIGGGASALTIQNQSTTLTTAANLIDFTGPGVTATNIGGAVTVNIPGGGAGGPYGGASPTTLTVGGIPSGSPIFGLTYDQLWQDLLVPYIAPTFTSFIISGQTQSVEVGSTVSGLKSFAWAFSNPALVTANTMDILDVTGATTLASGISIVSPYSVSIGSITLTSPSTYSWRGRATNTQSTVFNSSNFTISWFWRKYYGTNASASLNETQIEALINNPLSNTLVGSYSFAAGDYKYFCWPDSFGSPTSGPFPNGFISAGLGVSMASSIDDPFYSNTQNGWSYGLVSVTNINGIATNYRVYRTLNTLGSTVIITVN
jgi:hypothetical protein